MHPWEIYNLQPETTLEKAAHIVLVIRFEQLLSYRKILLKHRDIDSVHDMRVASRRLRAAIQCFQNVFPKKEIYKFRSEIKNLTKLLGSVRDVDILIANLLGTKKELPNLTKSNFIELITYLENLRQDKFQVLQNFLKNWNPQIPICSHKKTCNKKLAKHARQIISKLVQNYLKYKNCLDNMQNIEEHHAMRIAGKRLRYALEIFKYCIPNTNKILETLRHTQETLGDLHDVEVLISFCINKQTTLSKNKTLSQLIEFYYLQRDKLYKTAITNWQQTIETNFIEELKNL